MVAGAWESFVLQCSLVDKQADDDGASVVLLHCSHDSAKARSKTAAGLTSPTGCLVILGASDGELSRATTRSSRRQNSLVWGVTSRR